MSTLSRYPDREVRKHFCGVDLQAKKTKICARRLTHFWKVSPIPAVKTSASRPPGAATIEPMPACRRCTKISKASLAQKGKFTVVDLFMERRLERPPTARSPDKRYLRK
jgi:hypothetical protein